MGSYRLWPVAATGERFSDFGPYVASINNAGFVAFQATLKVGGSGVYTSDGAGVTTIVDTTSGPLREVTSHPDVSADGSTCFYAALASGGGGVFLVRRGELTRIADSHGPLGPTMSARGDIAFRAGARSGHSAIFKAAASGAPTLIADDSGRYAAFHGLPVINSAGAVAFRADLTGGAQGIYLHDGDRITTVVETGDTFSGLGRFPFLAGDGAVAFCAALREGGAGVFTWRDGRIETILDTRAPFESFRGVLLTGAGRAVFYATPRAASGSGGLGIFTGPDPARDCLLCVGAPLFGSTVVEFALNPVSINDPGQLAIRICLADDRRFILRADPLTDSRTAVEEHR
jgi:hypothetical protein